MQAAFGSGGDAEVRLALLGLRVDRLEHLGAPADREAALAAVERLLADQESDGRWVVRRDGTTWWLVVPGLDTKGALALARALVEAGRNLTVDVAGRTRRLSLSCGLALSCHRTQPSLATCAAVVEEGLRVAAAGGGRRAVHSEVYGAFADAEPAPAPLVEPAPPAAAAREVELPRVAPPAGPPASAPVAPPAPTPEAARDWSQWLHGGTGVPAAQPVEAPAPEAPAPPPGPEGELLHRRLTKMTVELERAEAEIARLRAALSRDQLGLASIYREVQGLSDDAPAAELKREMMERLFQANVALRELTQRLQRA